MANYLKVTEYLPSDIVRTLGLLRKMDETFEEAKKKLEEHTLAYSKRPRTTSLNSSQDPDMEMKDAPQTNGVYVNTNTLPASPTVPSGKILVENTPAMQLRVSLARSLKKCRMIREQSRVEADRLQLNVSRHLSRAQLIHEKIQQIKIPDDVTQPDPAKDASKSPKKKVVLRLSRGDTTPRSSPKKPPKIKLGTNKKAGETDGEGPVEGVDGEQPIKKKRKASNIGPRQPPPPPPTLPNGEPLPDSMKPWNQLMAHEMAKLRKRMKKNSTWTPSTAMILKELESLGRGPKFKEQYKHQWMGKQPELIPPEQGGIGDIAIEAIKKDNVVTGLNRGHMLAMAKKRKKERERAEAEARKRAEEAAASGTKEGKEPDGDALMADAEAPTERESVPPKDPRGRKPSSQKGVTTKREVSRPSNLPPILPPEYVDKTAEPVAERTAADPVTTTEKETESPTVHVDVTEPDRMQVDEPPSQKEPTPKLESAKGRSRSVSTSKAQSAKKATVSPLESPKRPPILPPILPPPELTSQERASQDKEKEKKAAVKKASRTKKGKKGESQIEVPAEPVEPIEKSVVNLPLPVEEVKPVEPVTEKPMSEAEVPKQEEEEEEVIEDAAQQLAAEENAPEVEPCEQETQPEKQVEEEPAAEPVVPEPEAVPEPVPASAPVQAVDEDEDEDAETVQSPLSEPSMDIDLDTVPPLSLEQPETEVPAPKAGRGRPRKDTAVSSRKPSARNTRKKDESEQLAQGAEPESKAPATEPRRSARQPAVAQQPPPPATPAPEPRGTKRKRGASTQTEVEPTPAPVPVAKKAKRKSGPRWTKKRKTVASEEASTPATPAVDEDSTALLEDEDLDIDIDEGDDSEERFCLCRGVSRGIMVCCDNPKCEKEWFHLDCVGLRVPPKARVKWFCPECKEKMESGKTKGKSKAGSGRGSARGKK